jgi:hypothetical protein
MPSIEDHINSAEQTRVYPNSATERRWAVRLVCSYAHDADDARELCTALGLDPRDGRGKAMPPSISSVRLAVEDAGRDSSETYPKKEE